MDINIPLPFAALGAVITLAIGYLVALINTDDRHRKIAKKREVQIRQELEQYKSEVREHFGQSSKLFSQVTEQYRQLYLHMSQGARLLGNVPPTPLLKKLEKEQRSEARRRKRAEPTLTEPALDNALVELRDDLNQFNANLKPAAAPTPVSVPQPVASKVAATTAAQGKTSGKTRTENKAVVWRQLTPDLQKLNDQAFG